MMKKLFPLLLSFWFLLPLEAQKTAQQIKNYQEYSAQRIAFYTAEVGITPEEAASFFPLYDEMAQKKIEIFMTARRKQREALSRKANKETNCMTALDETLKAKLQEAQLEIEYYEKFKQILSAEKLLKFKQAEPRFAKTIIHQQNNRP